MNITLVFKRWGDIIKQEGDIIFIHKLSMEN